MDTASKQTVCFGYPSLGTRPDHVRFSRDGVGRWAVVVCTFHRALDGYTFESFRLIKRFHEHPCGVSHSERRFARKADLSLFRLSASDLTAKRPACINSAWSCFRRWIQRFADSREHKSESPRGSSKRDQAVLLHWGVPDELTGPLPLWPENLDQFFGYKCCVRGSPLGSPRWILPWIFPGRLQLID